MTSIKEMKQAAKAQLNGKWLLTVGVLIVASLIISALSYTVIGALVFAGVMEFGICAYLVSVTRNKDAGFTKLFVGFNRFGDSCVTGILKTIYETLWSLLLVIPGIVKSYSYAMTMFIMQDHPELSGNAAITKSREMMDGHKFDLFLLDLSFIGWYLLGILTFGILIIFYVEPYHAATRANFYEQLRVDTEGAPVKPEATEVDATETEASTEDKE